MDTRMKEKMVIDAFKQAYEREHLEKGWLFIPIKAPNILVQHSVSCLGPRALYQTIVGKERHMTTHRWNLFTEHLNAN